MIVEHQDLSMEKHVLPILISHGYRLEQDQELDWWADGSPISVCNSNELFTRNRKIAELLSEKCRPFGKELKVHLFA